MCTIVLQYYCTFVRMAISNTYTVELVIFSQLVRLGQLLFYGLGHRRRIKTGEKAKVVATVWGEEFIKFLAALAVLHWTI